MIEILEKVELETVERKVVFPQVLESPSIGPLVIFTDGCGLWANGDRSDYRMSDATHMKRLKELKLQITARDGTEWPRIVKCNTTDAYYLWIYPPKAVALTNIDGDLGHRAGDVLEDHCVTTMNTKPLPPGTRTILMIREGEVECEIQEPVDWFPEAVHGCTVKRRGQGFYFSKVGYSFSDLDGVRELHEFTGKLIAEQEAKAGA